MIKIHDIAILLATYNGTKYLSEQINSLIAQTYQNWQLFIHDDGSTDDTLTILHKYEKLDSRIHILSYPPSGGAYKNFMSLLNLIDAPYYMFCDQDDVWLENKITICMDKMQELEKQYPNSPIITHTDLKVVDEQLKTISSSFWQYEKIVPNLFKSWEDYSRGNLVTGCTMLFNHSAKICTQPFSDKTLMHDAWITLCVAAQKGIIVSIPTSTILYRQHGDNALGAQDAKRFTWIYRVRNIKKMMVANWAYFQQMNAIRYVSIISYIAHKIK